MNRCLEQFPYIDDAFDSYNTYEKLSKIVEYLNLVIDATNASTEEVERLTNLYNELKSYVDNYFTNLDIQQEIDNKLDQMVIDGVFDDILKNYANVTKIYKTFIDLKEDTKIIENMNVYTLGYYTPNDGGNARYIITSVEDSSKFQEQLQNGLFATLITDKINVKTVGIAESNSPDNNTVLLQKIVNLYNTIEIQNINFSISNSILLNSNNNILINNSTITNISEKNKTYIFNIQEKENVNILGKNSILKFNNSNVTDQCSAVKIAYSKNVLVSGFEIYNIGGDSFLIGGNTLIEAENIKIENNIIHDLKRNGISLIGATNNIIIKNNSFYNIKGLVPEAGIDLESWMPELFNKNIYIINNTFKEGNSIIIFENNINIQIINNINLDISIKTNTAINNLPDRHAKNIILENNKIKLLYLYNTYGTDLLVNNNIIEATSISSSIRFTEDIVKNSANKLYINNTFTKRAYIENSAKINFKNNLFENINNIKIRTVENLVFAFNNINGFNIDPVYTEDILSLKKAKNVYIHDNIVDENTKSTITNSFVYLENADNQNCFIYNNKLNGSFTYAAKTDGGNDNIDYNNKLNGLMINSNIIPVPSKKFSGIIINIKSGDNLISNICTYNSSSYIWKPL